MHRKKIAESLRKGEPDKRKRIDTPNVFPWCVHGLMVMDYTEKKGESQALGSGTIVDISNDGCTVITAGHNLWDREYGVSAKTVTFRLGYGSKAVCYETKCFTFSRLFKETEDDIEARNHDLGVVVIPGVNSLKTLKLLSLKHNELLKHKVNVTGYPADKKDGLMYTMEGPVGNFNHPHRFFYNIQTYGGNSGSGVWLKHLKEEHCCVGVHTYGIDPNEPYDSNSGTRLTRKNIEKVKLWARTLIKLGT